MKLTKLLFELPDSIMVEGPLMREALFEVEDVVMEESCNTPSAGQLPAAKHTQNSTRPRKAPSAHHPISLASSHGQIAEPNALLPLSSPTLTREG